MRDSMPTVHAIAFEALDILEGLLPATIETQPLDVALNVDQSTVVSSAARPLLSLRCIVSKTEEGRVVAFDCQQGDHIRRVSFCLDLQAQSEAEKQTFDDFSEQWIRPSCISMAAILTPAEGATQ